MNVCATQIFRGHHFSSGGFDLRRPTQKDGPLVFDDDALVTHGRHVRPTRRTGTEDSGDLWTLRRSVGLDEKRYARNALGLENLVLHGQKRAPGIHEINAWQAVFFRNALGPKSFLTVMGK